MELPVSKFRLGVDSSRETHYNIAYMQFLRIPETKKGDLSKHESHSRHRQRGNHRAVHCGDPPQ